MSQDEAEVVFAREFARVAQGASDLVVVHSALWAFGHHFKGDLRRLPERLLEIMIAVLGPSATLAFPTYSFTFCRERVFDPVRTKSEVGVLTEVARKHSAATRSRQPVYSYAFIGPKAQDFQDLNAQTAWGKGSAMERFDELNARHVVLGLEWHQGASIIHRAEELAQVPYRYFKRFSGRLQIAGEDGGPIEETFYVRASKVAPQFDFSPASIAIRSTSAYRASANEDFYMEAADTADIISVSRALLGADPYTFVANKSELRSWVAMDRNAELASLATDEVSQIK